MTTQGLALDGAELLRLSELVYADVCRVLDELVVIGWPAYRRGVGKTMPDCTRVGDEALTIALGEHEPGLLGISAQLDGLPDHFDVDLTARQLAELTDDELAEAPRHCRWRATTPAACGVFGLERTTGELWLVHTHAQFYRPEHYYS